MADPATRIVSLTITEGGYLVNQVTGEFDAADPSIQADLARRRRPRDRVRLHHRGAGRRRATRASAVHGDVLRQHPGQRRRRAQQMIAAFARLKDADAGRLDRGARCASRTPWSTGSPRSPPTRTARELGRAVRRRGRLAGGLRAVHPVGAGGPLRRRAGRRSRTPACSWSPDVEPYELMKLRLLNASHQALCYLGYLAGYRYAHEVCQDPLFAAFLLGYMDREATPTLAPVPGVDLDAYKHQLDRAVRQPRGARHPGPAVRRELRPHPEVAGAGHPGQPAQPAARSRCPRPGGRRAGPATPRASTSRASRSRSSTGCRDTRRWRRAGEQREDPLAFIRDRDLFGDLVDDERFAAAYRWRWTRCTRKAPAPRSRPSPAEPPRERAGRHARGGPARSR